jgi:hypothetical protein
MFELDQGLGRGVLTESELAATRDSTILSPGFSSPPRIKLRMVLAISLVNPA